MILLNNNIINIDDINIKNKLYYSDKYTFIPVLYKNENIIIQTPKLYSQYGIYNKDNYNSIKLSLRNKINDKNIINFEKNLSIIFKKIKDKFNEKYIINDFLKNDNDKYIRFKIQDNTLYFDQNKNKLNTIQANTYGNYIINLYGIWIIENNIYFQWYILQAKIYIPPSLNEYSFIEEKKNIPPPPPLPPQNFKKKIINKDNTYNDVKINEVKTNKKNNNKDIKVPSLLDIKNALLNLKSIK